MARIDIVRQLSRVFAALLLLTAAMETRADCGALDYLCQANALASRVAASGSIVKGAKSTVKTLSSDVSKVQAEFGTVQADAGALTNDAKQVLDAFTTAYNTINSDALKLSDMLVHRLNDGRRLIDYEIEQEKDAYDSFVGSTGCSARCETFRSQLAEMVTNYERTFNLLQKSLLVQMQINGISTTGVEILPLDLSYLAGALNRAPGIALFPIYQALGAVSAQSVGGSGGPCAGDPACLSVASLNEMFATLEASLNRMIQTAGTGSLTSSGLNSVTFDATSTTCLILFKSDQAESDYTTAAWVMGLVGTIVESVGEALIAWSMDEVDTSGGVSVALTVVVGLERKTLRSIGSLIRFLGSLAFTIGQQLDQTIASCRTDLNNQLLLCFVSSDPALTFAECKDKVRQGEDFGL